MKLKYLFVALALLLNVKVFAQTGRDVKGLVKDSTGVTLPGTTVKIITDKDSSAIITDANGSFIFHNVTVNQFSLVVVSMGYQPIKRRFILDNKTTPFTLLPIVLKSDTRMLGVVTITDVNAVKLKEDTVEFNAAAYKVRDGAPVEDVIKKLPGVDVDKDGNVTAQGKSVTKIRVNGKDFFGGDLKTATKNLPADIVQSIQVIDDYGDQANITGIKTGEPEKVLNINIKPSKNYGYFGQATVGGGQDMIPNADEKGRYVASGNLFRFDGDRQLAVLGNLNNTNTNLFSFGSPPGGGGGPRGGGPGGNANAANGITTARSIGFNYRDSWSKKTTVYGSYSFANNTVNTTSTTIQNNISLNNPSTNNQSSVQETSNLNHRFNFNIEYKPDTLNYLKITPSFSFAGVTTDQNAANTLINATQTISDYTFNSYLHSTSPSFGGNVLYNHRFPKKGRNFSLNIGAGSYHIDQYQNPIYTYIEGAANAPLNQFINTASRTDSVGVNVSYLEPLAKKSYLEFTYGYKNQNTTSDRSTDTLTTGGVRNNYALLTNDYQYTFITNRFGLNFRFIDKKYNYTLGVVAQPSILEGNSPGFAVNRKTEFNVAPTARFIYNFSRSQSLSINYNGTSQQPTYTQLQPVTDYSNASYPVTGNPDLKPEFNNVLSVRYNKFDFATGNVFFSNLSFTQSNNKIVSTTINYPVNASDPNLAGTILTTYQNADGYYAANAFYVFAKPWAKRKYNLFFQGNANYNNNISYIGGFGTDGLSIEKNIAKNLVLSQGVRFRVNITDVIDAEANTTYAINRTTNSLSAANVNTKFSTLNLGLNGKNYFFKDWTLSYDFTKQIYYGYQGATNPNILNTYVERRFLKGNVGTLRFAVNDVFNENTGYTTTSSGSFITQTNANRLGRYFLLTFTLRLQKFAGARPSGPGGPGGPGMGGPGPGGPGGSGPGFGGN
ncbi:outer membrane beta-barrel protein [Mucilaginibacter sp. ZT4R22]|uniref:Outer membrane beta-barrel protein n=1 Tax=Mucilaginibacter pankratovii TaxID=2772110 RepID=A0ABR7WXI5_9SPHI|nr:outer membrane beta-barrel protein [Mucilaginibacter pankratovii]MBD1366988.1 outer membrane beta-barrel protein [Mucilaginibacter pankratovii]